MSGARWPQSRTCATCGFLFLAYAEHPAQKYCSLSHSRYARVVRPIRPCPVCEAPFKPYKRHQRYCSVACSNRARAQRRSTAMNYLPPTSAILIHQIKDGWRADLTQPGRELKAAGVSGREQLAKAVIQAAARGKP
jgi:predicted nucleic acid-binding Zn ribbon protein